MSRGGWLSVIAAVLCLAAPLHAEEEAWLGGGGELLADYNSELRGADGRLDVEEMVERLAQLKVNVYFYLIWHAETDWDDLKLFLPAAADAGIDVWAYLVPPSESPPIYGTRYSEPFRLDYVRWGQEIALLSIQYPNLKAWVIDDFLTNPSVYTPDYVGRMQATARAVNPDMKFLPLMYYHQIDTDFVTDYGPVIDGVVAAYPPSDKSIQSAWLLLNDRLNEPQRWAITYPWQTRSSPGYHGTIRRRFHVESAGPHTIELDQRDDFAAVTSGYHFKQLLVDGAVVWEEDVAHGDRDWSKVSVDVSQQVTGKSTVEVAFRVYDRKGVSNFGVVVEAQEPAFSGLLADSTDAWRTDVSGPFTTVVKPAYKGEGRFHLPLVVMIAASPSSFAKRNGEPATVDRYAEKMQMALAQMRNGFAEGVVTYTLPKYVAHDYYNATWHLYLKTLRSASPDFDADGDVDFSDFLLFAAQYGKTVGRFDKPDAAFDLDVDGEVGFGDFLILAAAYGR